MQDRAEARLLMHGLATSPCSLSFIRMVVVKAVIGTGNGVPA